MEEHRRFEDAGEGFEASAVWAAAELGAEPGERGLADAAQRIADSTSAADAIGRRMSELSASGDLLSQIHDRWSGTTTEQFAGRLFEWHQGTTFNMNAAELNESSRALVTEFQGIHPDPHDAADLRVMSGSGETSAEFQAKVISSTANRVHDLASERYQGLGLVAPSDHVESAQDLLTRRAELADPNFLRHADYASVKERLTEQIAQGNVSSDPIDSKALHAAANDPDGFLSRMHEHEASALREQESAVQDALSGQALASLMQVVGAAGAGAVGGFAASLAISGTANAARVLSGKMPPMAAAIESVTTARGAMARGAFVGGVGQGLKLAASTGLTPDAFAGGMLPYVAARATWEVATIGVAYARGEINAQQAAAKSGKSLLRIGFAYGGATVGQCLIPIPIAGALIGGAVGSLCAGITIQALSAVSAAADDLRLTQEALARLQVEVEAAAIVLDAEIAWMRAATADRDIAFDQTVIPAIETIETELLLGDFVAAVPAAAQIIEAYRAAPLFSTVSEFDEWMRDPKTTLVLNPNPK